MSLFLSSNDVCWTRFEGVFFCQLTFLKCGLKIFRIYFSLELIQAVFHRSFIFMKSEKMKMQILNFESEFTISRNNLPGVRKSCKTFYLLVNFKKTLKFLDFDSLNPSIELN